MVPPLFSESYLMLTYYILAYRARAPPFIKQCSYTYANITLPAQFQEASHIPQQLLANNACADDSWWYLSP